MNCLNCGFISFKLAKKCGNCGTSLKKLSQYDPSTLVRNKAFAIYIGSVGDSTAVEQEEKEFEIESTGLDTPPTLDYPPSKTVDSIDKNFDLDLSDAPKVDVVALEPEKPAAKGDLAKTVGLAAGLGVAATQSLDLGTSEAVSRDEVDGDFVLDLDSVVDEDSDEVIDDLEPKVSIEAGKIDSELEVPDSEEKLEPVGEADLDITGDDIELGLEEPEIKENGGVAQEPATAEDNDTEFELEEFEVEEAEPIVGVAQEPATTEDNDTDFEGEELNVDNAKTSSNPVNEDETNVDGDVEFELESVEDEGETEVAGKAELETSKNDELEFELETNLEFFDSENDVESAKEEETKAAVKKELGFELEELESNQVLESKNDSESKKDLENHTDLNEAEKGKVSQNIPEPEMEELEIELDPVDSDQALDEDEIELEIEIIDDD